MLFLESSLHNKPKTHYKGVRFLLKGYIYDIIDYLDSIHPADKEKMWEIKEPLFDAIRAIDKIYRTTDPEGNVIKEKEEQ